MISASAGNIPLNKSIEKLTWLLILFFLNPVGDGAAVALVLGGWHENAVAGCGESLV